MNRIRSGASLVYSFYTTHGAPDLPEGEYDLRSILLELQGVPVATIVGITTPIVAGLPKIGGIMRSTTAYLVGMQCGGRQK